VSRRAQNGKLLRGYLHKKIKKQTELKEYLCKFAASYFQIMFNGPRMVWRYGAKKLKIEVPKRIRICKNGTYKAYIRIVDGGKTIKMRGYLGVSLFVMTVDWKREDKVRPAPTK
jgi:hypothetical protein